MNRLQVLLLTILVVMSLLNETNSLEIKTLDKDHFETSFYEGELGSSPKKGSTAQNLDRKAYQNTYSDRKAKLLDGYRKNVIAGKQEGSTDGLVTPERGLQDYYYYSYSSSSYYYDYYYGYSSSSSSYYYGYYGYYYDYSSSSSSYYYYYDYTYYDYNDYYDYYYSYSSSSYYYYYWDNSSSSGSSQYDSKIDFQYFYQVYSNDLNNLKDDMDGSFSKLLLIMLLVLMIPTILFALVLVMLLCLLRRVLPSPNHKQKEPQEVSTTERTIIAEQDSIQPFYLVRRNQGSLEPQPQNMPNPNQNQNPPQRLAYMHEEVPPVNSVNLRSRDVSFELRPHPQLQVVAAPGNQV